MSRHRGVRNRVYSYDEDDYDNEEYEEERYSPTSHQFMYNRGGDNTSIFSFIEDKKNKGQEEEDEFDDSELVRPALEAIQQSMGSVKYKEEDIVELLRKNNYDVNRTVMDLLEKPKPKFDVQMVIPVPSLEKVVRRLQVDDATEKVSKVVDKDEATEGFILEAMNEAGDDDDVKLIPMHRANDLIPEERVSIELSSLEKQKFQKADAQLLEACQAAQIQSKEKDRISMVVVGHVDAGKSTIMGHLLYRMGYVSKKMMHKFEKESKEVGKASFAYAWVMDADEEERSRGVTMDVGMGYFETDSKHVTLLDAPGHKDFVPRMITGAAQADVALLVVPAAVGEYEAAFESSGQTREHTLLVRSLGVTQMIVAVNKMDMVNWSQERFEHIQNNLSTFLQQSGFKLKNLWFIPMSGMQGENLSENSVLPELKWYSGSCLVKCIDNFAPPVRPISKPFRMGISDIYKSMGLGNVISGKIYAGVVSPGAKLLYMPMGLRITVKGIERGGKSVSMAAAGDNIELGVSDVDPSVLSTRGMLCSIVSPVKLVKRFRAQLMTMPSLQIPLVKGSSATLHIHTLDEPVHITKLIGTLNSSGDIVKKRPRCIARNTSANVEIVSTRALCLEEFADFRHLGRFTLRDRGNTLAAGIVTEIME